MTPKHILAATDLEETSLPALRMALDLASGLGARVTLVHVIEPIASPPGLEAYALEGMPADWEQRVERGRLGAVHRRLEGGGAIMPSSEAVASCGPSGCTGTCICFASGPA